ncbi:MAG: hypothetical protein ACTHJN_10780 [Ginsengibacter sp.]
MRYLVTTKFLGAFLTDWFVPENHFNIELGMIVYDLVKCLFTTDGQQWKPIEVDHL